MYLFNKKRKKIISPNILITNYCNQNCNFCFAKKVMTKDKIKEMSLEKYVELIDKLKIEEIKTVRLMGGEPTLHGNFTKIINLTIKSEFDIELFTNGFFNQKIEKFLLSKKNNISIYHINVATPNFQIIEKRKMINNFINKAKNNSNISLEITIDSLDKDKYLNIFKGIGDNIKYSSLRIGVDGYFLKQGGFNIKKYQKTGKLIIELVDCLIKKKVKGVWLSEIYRCMFNDDQIIKLNNSNKVIISGFGCLSKRAGVDIKADLKVIRCFNFEAFNGIDFNNNPLIKIKKKLDKNMINKSKKCLPLECKKCDHHGYSDGKCPGPCLVGE